MKPDPKRKGDKGIRYLVAYAKPDGKPTQKKGFLTKTAAKNWAIEIEGKKRDGEYVAPAQGRVTVAQLAPGWLKHKEASVKQSHYRPLESSWRNHVEPRWGHVRVADVTAESVEQWITEMRLAAQKAAEQQKAKGRRGSDGTSNILRNHGVLAGILDLAVKAKRLPRNPARGIENLPKKQKKTRHIYLSSEDVQRLAVNTGQHRVLVLTLAYCGLRWGEAIGLRVRDIDYKRGRISVTKQAVEEEGFVEREPKYESVRDVPVAAFVLDELRSHLKGRKQDALVFPKPGEPDEYLLRPDSGRSWFQGAVKRAKIQSITPHDLRHTCASLAVSAGANVMALARMLGHTDPSVTLRTYADLFDTDLDRVAETMHDKYGGMDSCQILVMDRSKGRKTIKEMPLTSKNGSEAKAVGVGFEPTVA
ncbi:site-specific integrase [Nocardia terpenica]